MNNIAINNIHVLNGRKYFPKTAKKIIPRNNTQIIINGRPMGSARPVLLPQQKNLTAAKPAFLNGNNKVLINNKNLINNMQLLNKQTAAKKPSDTLLLSQKAAKLLAKNGQVNVKVNTGKGVLPLKIAVEKKNAAKNTSCSKITNNKKTTTTNTKKKKVYSKTAKAINSKISSVNKKITSVNNKIKTLSKKKKGVSQKIKGLRQRKNGLIQQKKGLIQRRKALAVRNKYKARKKK